MVSTMNSLPIGRAASRPARSPVRIRVATPLDIPALMVMKWALAVSERSESVLIAADGDWRRDGFGPEPRFFSFVAEQDGVAVGMVTCNERYFTGWIGPTLVIQDLYVGPEHRHRGIGRALLASVAVHAKNKGIPLIELIVRTDNPARSF